MCSQIIKKSKESNVAAIKNDSAVTLHFTIKMKDGSVADSTENMGKPAKFVMGDGSLSENFEACLLGLEAGTEKSIELRAEDAFGMPNPDHIHYMDRAKFVGDSEVEVGTIMAFSGPDGMEIPGIITEIAGDSVTVDFNHPLAGQDVTFDVNILTVE
nr:FKBP-type peptidyl-prolyl cis-trans isomerase [Vibrio sp. 1CM23M]